MTTLTRDISTTNDDTINDSMPLLGQILMMARRSLVTLLRTPEAIIPNLIISAFFLLVYDAALGGTTDFLPQLEGVNYLAFILPVSVISASLNAPAGQAMVRDIESGYFDKLLLTPISRSALLLGHILASGVVIAAQSLLIIAIALLMGLQPATGIGGLLVVLLFSLFIGAGFGGFTVGVALQTGNAGATQGASFIFFPLTFLTTTFVPLELLSGWLKPVAQVNPVTYILDGLREVLIYGWNFDVIIPGLLACAVVSIVPFFFAVFSLRARTARK
jgi:ABC-2 type transport system permease protein